MLIVWWFQEIVKQPISVVPLGLRLVAYGQFPQVETWGYLLLSLRDILGMWRTLATLGGGLASATERLLICMGPMRRMQFGRRTNAQRSDTPPAFRSSLNSPRSHRPLILQIPSNWQWGKRPPAICADEHS